MGKDMNVFTRFNMLIRMTAVVFSSFVTVLSTSLPLFLFYSDIPNQNVLWTMIVLLLGSFLIHGLLTHIINDMTDFKTGTDDYSPGILSGGSRVIQSKAITYGQLRLLGIGLSVLLLAAAILFFIFGHIEYGFLVLIGMWGAVSYSLRPFMLAYKPFIGEWASLFPSMFALGIAAPWILLDTIPAWAWFNAIINALWCMAWVMVHHIPDIEADRQANPRKITTVVYAVNSGGRKFAHLPSVFYLLIILIILIIMILTRPVASILSLIMILITLRALFTMHNNDVEAATAVEKQMLITAGLTAVVLGIFI
ncbi:prenyltransferase [Salinicoccus albus]|uniref:prenyltransferase n=1 Tax=Salinicoccus albus TaxID=418756 RepID=UPI0003660A38|nr:prenyltransferase [Salinicoccus albus]